MVMGDWEGRGEGREGCLLGAVVECGTREDGFGGVGVEIMGGGRREEESGGVGGRAREAKVGEEGRLMPFFRAAPGTLTCDFF